MSEFSVHQAKTHLSRLLRRVSMGEEVIISRSGKRVARLVPYEAASERLLGVDEGSVWIADDFDAELPPDVLDEFER